MIRRSRGVETQKLCTAAKKTFAFIETNFRPLNPDAIDEVTETVLSEVLRSKNGQQYCPMHQQSTSFIISLCEHKCSLMCCV